MIFKVITVISLLKMCMGDGPQYPQPQSNQAIVSQSFVRHDVPLSYKHTWVHVYSTPAPEQEQHLHTSQNHPTRQLQLQYAPIYSEQTNQYPPAINNVPEKIIYNDRNDQYKHNDINKLLEKNTYNEQNNQYNSLNAIPEKNVYGDRNNQFAYNAINHLPEKEVYGQAQFQTNTKNTLLEKVHIEPRPESVPNKNLAYVPGYNIEVLQAVNRYPGHNAVFRSYPNMAPHEKLNKMNFLNQYVLYQNQDEHYATTTQAPKPREVLNTKAPARPKPAFVQKVPEQKPKPFQIPTQVPNINLIPLPQELIEMQEYLPHPKAHRMLLNIARTYNIAQNALQAQHAGLMLKNMPSHTQAFIQIRQPSEAEKGNLLSVQNKDLYSPIRVQ